MVAISGVGVVVEQPVDLGEHFRRGLSLLPGRERPGHRQGPGAPPFDRMCSVMSSCLSSPAQRLVAFEERFAGWDTAQGLGVHLAFFFARISARSMLRG